MFDLFFRLFQKKNTPSCSCHKLSLLWTDSQLALTGIYFHILSNMFTINFVNLLLCILIIVQALARY